MPPPIKWENGVIPEVPSKITHCAFSDESHWSKGQYRSICLITLPISNVEFLREKTQAILQCYKIREFKWVELQSSKERIAAIELVKYYIVQATRNNLRIDVLGWNTFDSRQ